MLRVAEVLRLALCSLISFLSTPNVSFHEVRFTNTSSVYEAMQI